MIQIRAGVYIALLTLAAIMVETPHARATHKPALRVAYASLGLPQAPLWIADEGGYFQEAGLRVDTVYIQNSSTVVQSLAADEIDFAMVGPAPIVAADLRGADMVMIATTIPKLIFYLIARPEIQKVEDLKGKSIGFGRFGSNTDFAARLVLDRHKLTPHKDVAMIQTAGGIATVLAVSAGKVHSGITTDVGMLEGKKLGLRELVAIKDLGVPFAHAGFAAKRSFLKNHEKETLGFLRAISKGVYRMMADKPFSTKVIRRVSRLDDAAVVDAGWELHAKQFLQKTLYTTAPMIETVLRQMSETLPAAARANAGDYFDNRYAQILEQRGLYGELDREFKLR